MAEYLTLTLDQGAAFSQELEWQGADGQPVNLTGYTAKAQARAKNEDSPLILEFQVTLGGPAGTITLSASATATDAVRESGNYDLYLTPPGGEPIRLLQGPLEVSRRTTDA